MEKRVVKREELIKLIEEMQPGDVISLADSFETEKGRIIDAEGWWAITKAEIADGKYLHISYFGGGYIWSFPIDHMDADENEETAFTAFEEDCIAFDENDYYCIEEKKKEVPLHTQVLSRVIDSLCRGENKQVGIQKLIKHGIPSDVLINDFGFNMLDVADAEEALDSYRKGLISLITEYFEGDKWSNSEAEDITGRQIYAITDDKQAISAYNIPEDEVNDWYIEEGGKKVFDWKRLEQEYSLMYVGDIQNTVNAALAEKKIYELIKLVYDLEIIRI